MAGSAERYLIDTSAVGRIFDRTVVGVWEDALRGGRIGLCEPTEFEILYSARSTRDYQMKRDNLRQLYGWFPVPKDSWMRALETQGRMVAEGSHRSAGVTDVLVALTAQAHDLTVLHYDRDFETLSRLLGVRNQWLVEPGSVD